jgi:threonine dehydratase/serine racemase
MTSVQPHPSKLITLHDVKTAARHIDSYAHRTPVLTCETLNSMAGHQFFFKCENFQKTGAFKFRGAVNALSYLTPEQLRNGVVTHSSGNHAQALARAAALFETTAHIVMPSNAPIVKKNAVICYGGIVTECEPNLPARLETSERIQQETGATMIPPFNHPHVIAGQGTCALEFLQQVPHLDYLVVPIGGGGLISGTCISATAISHRVRVIGAEPAGADDAFRSKAEKKFIPQENPDTIADGLLTSMGQLTWPFIRDVVQRIITVTDEEIIAAMKLFLERTKILIEPSAAVAVAAAMGPKMLEPQHPRNIGVIISGGNVDLDQLPW